MTETQLKAKNKDNLINLVLNLQTQLESATAGPLTAAGLQRKVLDLQRTVISVEDNALVRKQEHEANMAKIKSDADIKLRELDLEYVTTDAVEAKELTELFKSLKDQSKKAEEDLTFGLKEAETNTNEELIKIREKVEEADSEAEKTIVLLTNSVLDRTSESLEKSEAIKTNHDRTMESLEYENSIAIRDKLLGTATEIAKKYESSIVTNSDLEMLNQYKKLTEEELTKVIEDAEKVAKSEVHRSEGAKFNAFKSNSENIIALAENNIENLEVNNADLRTRVEQLQSQVQAFPGQIKDAVEAAKVEITNTVDATKK